MKASVEAVKVSVKQQRVLKLLFKFRFVSTQLLADVIGISRRSVYEMLEIVVRKGLVDKVYEKDFRYAKKPAYYYLNKSGVTTVRKLMGVSESTVHALYKNSEVSTDFIAHCLKIIQCYVTLKRQLPADTSILAKVETSLSDKFPRTRPDLYVQTTKPEEAVFVIVDDQPLYIVRKRLQEVITHSEEEGWTREDADGNSEEVPYPRICFVLRHDAAKRSFLYSTRKKLDDMGIEDTDELIILATTLEAIQRATVEVSAIWSTPFHPKTQISLFD